MDAQVLKAYEFHLMMVIIVCRSATLSEKKSRRKTKLGKAGSTGRLSDVPDFADVSFSRTLVSR